LLTDMHDFNTVIINRMGGVGDGTGANGTATNVSPLTDSDLNAMRAFLDSQAAPDNPNLPATNADQVAAGLAVFTRQDVGCATCHYGPDFTDNSFHDVGSMINNTPTGQSETAFFPNGGVNTPSLHNLFATAPYLHDGSMGTIKDRVSNDMGGKHGHTAQLSGQEIDDLVAFLQTL
jgi:cytochrome c peroxidase